MTADDYVNRVLEHLPRAMARGAQIGAELRGHIAARLAEGRSLDEVTGQLGDPAALAESYLSAVPLVAAPISRRIGAKLIDLALCLLVIVLLAGAIVGIWALAFDGRTREQTWVAFVSASIMSLVVGSVLFGLYTIVTEWRLGQTIGKRTFKLAVVRESGTRIGLGQSIVRQLPAVLQVYWIDVFFVFFTDRKQRAFELLSKTRVVVAEE
jgi:uncharacterized RDD family membrane protein YckC